MFTSDPYRTDPWAYGEMDYLEPMPPRVGLIRRIRRWLKRRGI